MRLARLLCSRNAHDETVLVRRAQSKAAQPHPLDVKGVMPIMLTLALGAEEGMEADDLLCSRNARPQKALVGRAQWKINQPPSLRDNE